MRSPVSRRLGRPLEDLSGRPRPYRHRRRLPNRGRRLGKVRQLNVPGGRWSHVRRYGHDGHEGLGPTRRPTRRPTWGSTWRPTWGRPPTVRRPRGRWLSLLQPVQVRWAIRLLLPCHGQLLLAVELNVQLLVLIELWGVGVTPRRLLVAGHVMVERAAGGGVETLAVLLRLATRLSPHGVQSWSRGLKG